MSSCVALWARQADGAWPNFLIIKYWPKSFSKLSQVVSVSPEMKTEETSAVEIAKQSALEVLHHNMRGPFFGLPRAAGWGYPEPYTRDCLICALGILVSGNQ